MQRDRIDGSKQHERELGKQEGSCCRDGSDGSRVSSGDINGRREPTTTTYLTITTFNFTNAAAAVRGVRAGGAGAARRGGGRGGGAGPGGRGAGGGGAAAGGV